MGYLFLVNESFETENIPEDKRDLVLNNFCDALDCIKQYPDTLYGTNELHLQNFSYGSIYTLLYGSWQEIKSEPTLSGISNTVLGLFHQLMFSKPGLFEIIGSKAQFDMTYADANYGYSGFDFNASQIPYIKCKHSWQKWKCEWLSNNQEEIIWDKAQDPFLPNRVYSNVLLWAEVINHQKDIEVKKNIRGIKLSHFMKKLCVRKARKWKPMQDNLVGLLLK